MPGPLVVSNAVAACSFGAAPSKLTTLPDSQVMVEGQPVAVIDDYKAVVNLAPFGLCSSVANPVVEKATTAAAGVLTPMPCVPNVTSPWTPGVPLVQVGGLPVVNATCTCTCAWGGAITVTVPGTTQTLG